MDDEELRAIAKKRLKKQADYRRQLLTFAGVAIFLALVWAVTDFGGYFWPIWPYIGLALGAIFGGIDAYGTKGKPISDDDVDAEVRRLKGN